MDIFRFLKKPMPTPIPMRCSHCNYELEFSTREVRLLQLKNPADPICSIKEACHICHIGFMIPVNFTDKQGKHYLFHKIKPKIKNLDTDTVMNRIFENPDNQQTFFFPPSD